MMREAKVGGGCGETGWGGCGRQRGSSRSGAVPVAFMCMLEVGES
jgi:hypothetical protein